MLALACGAIWAGLVGYLLYRVLRQFRAFRSSALLVSDGSAGLPSVSVIVPVRNEIENIDNCISGLIAQDGLGDHTSIIIVDDDSQDGTTAVIARRVPLDPRIRVIAAGPLPTGWVGKPHACWRGAASANSDWLCFIDADVCAAPGLVASALATACADGIDMLSLHPLQELGSFWERVVFPAGLLMIACAKSFRTASEDVANGQFLLIRRAAYFQVGGHAAVRGEICEDKALAGRVKEAGFCFRALAAEHLARTRMYRDFGSLWEGLSKNATEILGSRGATLVVAAAAFVIGWTTLSLPIILGAAVRNEFSPAAATGSALALLASVAVVGIQFGVARHFRLPAAFGLTFPLGYTMAAGLACRSVLAHLEGRVTWKGRTYLLHKSALDRT
jgi:chlorobactene glucosyltransferase